MSYLDRIEMKLAQIRAQQRYREILPRPPSSCIDFSSNDYLGLATDPQVVEALNRATRVGSGGARLLAGRSPEHALLEEELADWLGRERALLFSSGYLAALGAIAVLDENTQTILSDDRNHASLIDGVRLARKPRKIYPHATVPVHDSESALIVSETIFSMDGDAIDPGALLRSLHEGDALLLDEAHAIGVTGREGAGMARDLGDRRVVIMGTLSKALGAHGGFIAGPRAFVDLLVNRARSFIYDTALPPSIALAGQIGLHLARRGDDRRARLHANLQRLRAALRERGFRAVDTPSPIVPVLLGDEERTVRVAVRLLENHIVAPPIRPPTVAPGSSRLRFSIRSDHTPNQIDYLVEQLQRCIATS